MRTHWVFNHCGAVPQASLQAYWQKKQPRLERLLAPFRPEQRDLRLTVYHHPQPPRWEVRGVLHLPSGTLAAEEADRESTAALDRLADYIFRRKHRQREDLGAADLLTLERR
jgi:ribosome-associated translation inhibitor RaiA